MRKDLKTGMIAGTALVVSALLLISVFSSSIEEERQQKSDSEHDGNASIQLTNLQSTTSTPAQSQVETQTRKKSSDNIVPDRTSPIPAEPQEHIHTVSEGETLTSISIEYYGSTGMWKKILNANDKIIKDADKLRPGMRLVIPKQ